MLEKFEFGAEVATAIAAAETALAEIVATRPPLDEAAKATSLAYDRAQHRWENFQLHVNRVTRHGADDASQALRAMIESELAKRDAAGAQMTRARKDLANVDWTIECRREDLAQLQLMVELPKPPVVREIVKRRAPDTGGDVDMIVMPAAESAA
jgi:Asp-tRNA(Asn)/Glu-tRNA(Gln) amidotransferase A subunit family amidase